tara:strand:+ start:1492 stop:2589 length:1098 start_codon:yes stop_codon:yes gene_type:complete
LNFLSEFKGKTVVITGHTGFKGVWLASWLNSLGAKVIGISLDPYTEPSHFKESKLNNYIRDLRIDVRNKAEIEKAISEAEPDYIFHLAAQALVRQSYEDPLETWEVNVLGTLNILEAIRNVSNPCAVVMITSDKCYDNVEWVWGYRETDPMGGPDPYSASKGAAELAIRSHIKSFFPQNNSKVRIASARAGNVIGGGDWSEDRIIPDCVKAWSQDDIVKLRNPHSTRPWQHVLEPLSGYLSLAVALKKDPYFHGQSFNFGPQSQQNHSVLDLVKQMSTYWDKVRWEDISVNETGPYESGLLKLNCDKALHFLNWHAVMEFQDTVKMTAEWYGAYYEKSSDIMELTNSQINKYISIAKKQGLKWAE